MRPRTPCSRASWKRFHRNSGRPDPRSRTVPLSASVGAPSSSRPGSGAWRGADRCSTTSAARQENCRPTPTIDAVGGTKRRWRQVRHGRRAGTCSSHHDANARLGANSPLPPSGGVTANGVKRVTPPSTPSRSWQAIVRAPDDAFPGRPPAWALRRGTGLSRSPRRPNS